MKAALLSIFALVFVSGCASYVEGGAFSGFNDTPLARDTYRIQSYGHEFSTRQVTNAVALVRAAELTATNGYDRFIVLDYDEWTKSEYYTTPATITTNTDVSALARTRTSASCSGWSTVYCGGNSTTNITGNSTSTTTMKPAQTHEIQMPRTDMVVKFVAFGSPESDTALLVHDVIARFGKAAGLKPEKAQLILLSVPAGSSSYSPPSAPDLAAAITPSVSLMSAATPSPERSIDDVYASLPPQERARVDAMPFNEQYVYLRSRR